jgi:tetratricopeptide (TPR) repeat protein
MLLFRRLSRSVFCRIAIPTVCLFGSFVLSPHSPANPATISAPAAPVAQGAELFQRGDFDNALNLFRQAEAAQPKDTLVQMWLGLGYEGTGEIGRAHAAWTAGQADPRFQKMAYYFKGLDFWRRGDDRSALYFLQASLKSAPGYAAAEQAMVEVKTGGLIPAIERWPALAGLPVSAPSTAIPFADPKPVETQVVLIPGARPRTGRWEARISNGYKGDRLRFRVSRDGKRVENLEFTGSWASRGSGVGLQTLKNLNPPAPFALAEGNFSGTQQAEKERLWWTASGRFLSTRTAEGTYRCAYAGGQNDTYLLKWTAKWVGR